MRAVIRRWIADLRRGVLEMLGILPSPRRRPGLTHLLRWLVTALEWTVALVLFGVVLHEDDNYGLLAAKLTLLGLVGAIGTFQYQTWQQITRSYLEVISRPEWFDIEKQLALLPQDTKPEYVELFKTTLDQRRQYILNFQKLTLPHNEAILWNAISAGTLLMLSSLCDIGRLLLPVPAAPAIRLLSTATFLASFGPFLDSAWRYALALKSEFDGAEKLLKAQAEQNP